MAGYTRLYCIGEPAGFGGADGVNPIRLQIWVGEGSRLWLQAHPFDLAVQPLGGVTRIVPPAPDHPDLLLDACVVFYPAFFDGCPTLPALDKELERRAVLADVDATLDWDRCPRRVRALWEAVREEGREAFARLGIYRALLEPVHTPPA